MYYKNGRHKISKSLKDSTVSKFVKRKWIQLTDLWKEHYLIMKTKTSIGRPDLCDSNDTYIVVKGRITVMLT